MTVAPVPEGFPTVAPYMTVTDAGKVIDFLKATFMAEIAGITYGPEKSDGTRMIMNADVKVGTARVLIADAREGAPATTTQLYCYVEDVDACHARAVAAGGDEMAPPMDMFYGDRHGGVVDPCGNIWYIAIHIEDVPDEELQKRADEMHAG